MIVTEFTAINGTAEKDKKQLWNFSTSCNDEGNIIIIILWDYLLRSKINQNFENTLNFLTWQIRISVGARIKA